MSHYFYKCFECNTEYDSVFIEDNFHYLCPGCGSAEKNKPLRGVLLIEYDYGSLRKKISRGKILSSAAGQISSYPELLPLRYSYYNENIFEGLDDYLAERIILPSHPVLNYGKLKVFDDTRNPTLSLKDRASLLVALKALQMRITEISAASTGNAGSSIAGICARFGMKSHIFVPMRIPSAKRTQIQIYGANLYVIQGDYDQAYDLCLEVSNEKNWYNRNTAYNPLTIEGKKTTAFDIFISTKGKLPEYIFIPSGDGVILSGIYKGFNELFRLGWIDKLPRLMCVQAEGSDAIIKYLEENTFEYHPAQSIADSICAAAPRNLFMAADAITSSFGQGIRVSDNEILIAQQIAASDFGILVEPAAAASLAGYVKYKDQNPEIRDENVMLIFTGNGLKDAESLGLKLSDFNIYSPDQAKAFIR